MEITKIIEIISHGEDGTHQFKRNITNADKLAAEIVAFSNKKGGMIIIGVNDSCEVTGLSQEDVGRLNQLISNVSSQHIRPPVHPETYNMEHPDGLIMVVKISAGINKPYMDNSGIIWIKHGSDKRKATSREEIQRMFQETGLIHGDEILATGLSIGNIDMDYFKRFFEKEYEEKIENQENSLPVLLENMNLAKNSTFNIAGALLFSKNPNFKLPVFIVKAVCFPGKDSNTENYLDSRDIKGKMSDIFQKSMSFINSNILHTQGNKTVNSTGAPEIPRIVFEELITNALLHRDYLISAPIRIIIFSNRIEIISPGHLPNNLTIENIKNGNSNIRNPILVSFASKLLPYRGIGSGIRRALNAYPDIEFDDDKAGNLFKVTIKKHKD